MVLVELNDNDINRVFQSPGVIRYMYWLGKRAVVRQSEIETLKNYSNGNYNFNGSEISEIKVGDSFNISNFKNESGTISRISNNNVWIYLKSIGYSVKLKLA